MKLGELGVDAIDTRGCCLQGSRRQEQPGFVLQIEAQAVEQVRKGAAKAGDTDRGSRVLGQC